VLPETPADGAVQLLERVAERWRAEHPQPPTFSAGVATVDDAGYAVALSAA
jgi:hypothetical protein